VVLQKEKVETVCEGMSRYKLLRYHVCVYYYRHTLFVGGIWGVWVGSCIMFLRFFNHRRVLGTETAVSGCFSVFL